MTTCRPASVLFLIYVIRPHSLGHLQFRVNPQCLRFSLLDWGYPKSLGISLHVKGPYVWVYLWLPSTSLWITLGVWVYLWLPSGPIWITQVLWVYLLLPSGLLWITLVVLVYLWLPSRPLWITLGVWVYLLLPSGPLWITLVVWVYLWLPSGPRGSTCLWTWKDWDTLAPGPKSTVA